MIGMDGQAARAGSCGPAGRPLSEDEVETTDRAAGAAFDRRNLGRRPLPGVREALAAIEAAGIPWVIATSSRQEQVAGSVAALGLDDAPEITDGSQVQHAKPAPDLLLLAASRLGVAPARCWAVGDSTWDMRATRRGGHDRDRRDGRVGGQCGGARRGGRSHGRCRRSPSSPPFFEAPRVGP